MEAIDILMSTYNGEMFIEEQLRSLLDQSHANINIIIRDDGSSDGTKKIVSAYAARFPDRIKFIDESKNLGSTKSFLRLLDLSGADYLMFCDQDDVWCRDKVERILKKMKELEAFQEKERPILIFSDLKVVDVNLNVLSESLWRAQKLDPSIALHWKRLLAQNVVTGCTMMLNKNIKNYASKDVDFKIHHDQLLAVLASKYGRVSWVDSPTVLYRQHQANVLGALEVDGSYLMKKFLGLKSTFKFFVNASRYFEGDVNVLELLLFKVAANIKRL